MLDGFVMVYKLYNYNLYLRRSFLYPAVNSSGIPRENDQKDGKLEGTFRVSMLIYCRVTGIKY